jgi:hypothetical protein
LRRRLAVILLVVAGCSPVGSPTDTFDSQTRKAHDAILTVGSEESKIAGRIKDELHDGREFRLGELHDRVKKEAAEGRARAFTDVNRAIDESADKNGMIRGPQAEALWANIQTGYLQASGGRSSGGLGALLWFLVVAAVWLAVLAVVGFGLLVAVRLAKRSGGSAKSLLQHVVEYFTEPIDDRGPIQPPPELPK